MLLRIFIILIFTSISVKAKEVNNLDYQGKDTVQNNNSFKIVDEFGEFKVDDWLANHYKQATSKYVYRSIDKESLKRNICEDFKEAAMKVSFFKHDTISEKNFVILKDLSIEFTPILNIILRCIVHPKNETVEEISIVANLSNEENQEYPTLKTFYILSQIAIGMINIDITKYDISDIYHKISLEEISTKSNHTKSSIIIDNIQYSTFYIGESIVFTAKKINRNSKFIEENL